MIFHTTFSAKVPFRPPHEPAVADHVGGEWLVNATASLAALGQKQKCGNPSAMSAKGHVRKPA
jgi:hypothetical protein